MSGVFGVVSPYQDINIDKLIAKMADSMCHFSWHISEYFADGSHQYAIRRIGINILNKEAQPTWNTDHTVALAMAGELYNLEDLFINNAINTVDGALTSDEEAVLLAYEHYGLEFAHHLEGAYVVAIWDQENSRLVLANDRYGLYPTYIAHSNGRFLFAPEVKAILQDHEVSRALRDDALAEYVRFQRLLGVKTFFSDIEMMPPASVLVYDYNTQACDIRCDRDFRSLELQPESITFNDAVEEGSSLLKAAVTKLTKRKTRVGLFLSGGFDSRSILGLIPASFKPIHTFTYGQPGVVMNTMHDKSPKLRKLYTTSMHTTMADGYLILQIYTWN